MSSVHQILDKGQRSFTYLGVVGTDVSVWIGSHDRLTSL